MSDKAFFYVVNGAAIAVVAGALVFAVSVSSSDPISDDMRSRIARSDEEILSGFAYEEESPEVAVVSRYDFADRFATAEHTLKEAEETETETVECITEATEQETEVIWYEADFTEQKPSVEISEEESVILQKLAIAEAGCYGPEGMAHIMRTVINRVESDQFPDTIEEVVFSPEQFSPVMNGGYAEAIPTEDSQEAFDMIMNGWDETFGATYFCTEAVADQWHSQTLTFMYQYREVMFWTYLADH